MAEVFSTTFSGYTIGDLAASSDWEHHNTGRSAQWEVLSGEVISHGGSGSFDSVQLVSSVSHADDQYCEATLSNVSTGTVRNIGLGLRMQPQSTNDNLYRLDISSSGGSSTECILRIIKRVNNSSTTLAASDTQNDLTFTIANGQVIRFEAEGSTLRGYLDGVEFVSATDQADFPGGQPGVQGFDVSSVDFSTFASGDITSGPTLSAPASISPGETISFTATGFTPTAATASDGTSTLTLTNIVNTDGDNYTADVPALPAVGESLQYTTFGAVTLSATDGTDMAEDTTVLAAAQGQTVTILAETFDTGELSYLFNFGGTPETGDQFIEGSADLALDANGGYVADTDGTYTITGIDATDGVAESYNLILGDDPVDPPAGIGRLTRRNLTSRKLTRRSLTARP